MSWGCFYHCRISKGSEVGFEITSVRISARFGSYLSGGVADVNATN